MYRVGGSRQRGGGNNPSCGCDMQAGWPPASEFPRGGLQGGGWDFNEFNLALTKNGKTRHLKGKWNSMENEMNETMNMNANMNMNAMSMNNKTNTKKKNKRGKTNKKKRSSAPNGYSNLAYKGKKYYKNNNSGEVFEITENGTLGNSIGYYVTPKSGNGKPYVTQMPPPAETQYIEELQQENRLSELITPTPKSIELKSNYTTQLPPEPETFNMSENYEIEPPEGEVVSTPKSLSLKGGRRHKTRKAKHHKPKASRRRR